MLGSMNRYEYDVVTKFRGREEGGYSADILKSRSELSATWHQRRGFSWGQDGEVRVRAVWTADILSACTGVGNKIRVGSCSRLEGGFGC